MTTSTTTSNKTTTTGSQAATKAKSQTPSQTQAELAMFQPDDPAWLGDILSKHLASVAHTFIVEGNTYDYYQCIGEKLRGCLISSLINKKLSNGADLFGVVVTFSLAGRFAFPTTAMRDKFLEIANKAATTVKLPAVLTADNLNILAGQYGLPFVLAALTSALSYKGSDAVPVCVILEYADTLVPAVADSAQLSTNDRTAYTVISEWSKDQIVGANGNINRQRHLVLLVNEEQGGGGIYPTLRRAIRETVHLPLPDTEARLAFLPALKATCPNTQVTPELTDRLIANATAGLTLRHLEDIFLMAARERVPVSMPLIRKRKDEIIKSEFGNILTIADPTRKLADLGGMITQKEYLVRHVVRPMLTSKTGRVPNGILLSGPAGTGKTVLAEALAGELGCTFVKFNISQIKDMYVGQSERNMQRALDALVVVQPAVLFVDEIDTVIGGGREAGGDGGVSGNIFGMLLSWAADTNRRGKVLLVGATNRPDLLDAALKREGRFDLKVPILAPEPAERPEILAVQLARYFSQVVGQQKEQPGSPNQISPEAAAKPVKTKAKGAGAIAETVANVTTATSLQLPTLAELEVLTAPLNNYTGAILERIASIAYGEWEDAIEWGEGSISILEATRRACEALLPTTSEIGEMSRLAIENCSDVRVLPPRYRTQLLESRQAALGGAVGGVETTRASSRTLATTESGVTADANFANNPYSEEESDATPNQRDTSF